MFATTSIAPAPAAASSSLPPAPRGCRLRRGDNDDRQLAGPRGRHLPEPPGLPGVSDKKEEQAERGA
jgi:hypothetical protein